MPGLDLGWLTGASDGPVLKMLVHKDVRGWVPSGEALQKLREHFESAGVRKAMGGEPLTVSFWPRSMLNEVLSKKFEPYAIRAVTRNGQSFIFCDSTETPKSIAWITAHELTHQVVARTPTLKGAFADAKATDLDPAGDQYHEVDAEERFCDGIATRIFGQRLDRDWWRERVRLSRQGLGKPATAEAGGPDEVFRSR